MTGDERGALESEPSGLKNTDLETADSGTLNTEARREIPKPALERKRKKRLRSMTSTSQSIADTLMVLAKASAIVTVLVWASFNHDQIELWLSSLSHAEAFGVKLDRNASDRATEELRKLEKRAVADKAEFVFSIGEAAIHRAVRVAPAIVGASVLWVDSTPSNNDIERTLLTQLKINVKSVTSTEQALFELRRRPYDLIISNVWRPKDSRGPLNRCKIHYFEFPSDEIKHEYEQPNGRGLEGFNDDSNKRGPAGFTMVEKIADLDADVTPPVIFYAAESAKIVRSLCGHTITNRRDFLLQAVVSVLEEQRWTELNRESRP